MSVRDSPCQSILHLQYIVSICLYSVMVQTYWLKRCESENTSISQSNFFCCQLLIPEKEVIVFCSYSQLSGLRSFLLWVIKEKNRLKYCFYIIYLYIFNWHQLILFYIFSVHSMLHISQDAFRSLEPVVGKMVHSVSFSTTGGQAWPHAGVSWGLNGYVGMYLKCMLVCWHIHLFDIVGKKPMCAISLWFIMIGFVWNFILWKSVSWPFGFVNSACDICEPFQSRSKFALVEWNLPMPGPHRLLRCVSANLRPRRCLSSILADRKEQNCSQPIPMHTHASIGMFRIFRFL